VLRFTFSVSTLLVGWQEGHLACKKLGDGLLVVTIWLELCTFYSSTCHLSPPPPSSLAPVKPANPSSPGKWPLKRRESWVLRCWCRVCDQRPADVPCRRHRHGEVPRPQHALFHADLLPDVDRRNVEGDVRLLSDTRLSSIQSVVLFYRQSWWSVNHRCQEGSHRVIWDALQRLISWLVNLTCWPVKPFTNRWFLCVRNQRRDRELCLDVLSWQDDLLLCPA